MGFRDTDTPKARPTTCRKLGVVAGSGHGDSSLRIES